MGYKTANEDSHECKYCGDRVDMGQGVLLKYSKTQSDEDIVLKHHSHIVGHVTCVRQYGTRLELEALKS